jgi:hypothetical protein
MARTRHFLTREQFVTVGRRHGCEDVALEASEADARWTRDLALLAGYGHGAAVLTAFQADRAAHAKLLAARPEAVAAKRTTVTARDKQISAAWTWVDRVESALGVRARSDEALSTALDEATPENDDGLAAGIAAMAKLLAANQHELGTDCDAASRLAEAGQLVDVLPSLPGSVQTAKSKVVADTAEIDEYDGRLYVAIRDLNRAGRRAIRNGQLNAKRSEYIFHRLKRSGNPEPQPAAPPETTPH